MFKLHLPRRKALTAGIIRLRISEKLTLESRLHSRVEAESLNLKRSLSRRNFNFAPTDALKVASYGARSAARNAIAASAQSCRAKSPSYSAELLVAVVMFDRGSRCKKIKIVPRIPADGNDTSACDPAGNINVILGTKGSRVRASSFS